MQTSATRYIEVTKDARGKLARAFNCTGKMVSDALTYRRSSDMARRIRYVAVSQYGGVPIRHCPECETLFTTQIDGTQYMRQTFLNGAVLLWRKGTSEVTVTFRDHDEVFDCLSMRQFYQIQLYAESLPAIRPITDDHDPDEPDCHCEERSDVATAEKQSPCHPIFAKT